MKRTVIITTQYRDLFYGTIYADNEEIARDKAVSVCDCRHIAYWHGPTGGITSLAAEGPDQESRIGMPCEALITGIAHVLDVSKQAQIRFAEVKP